MKSTRDADPRIAKFWLDYTQCYLDGINGYLCFHNNRHPCDCNESEVSSFLEQLTIQHKVASAPQSSALIAIAFFYTIVLK